MDNDLFEKLHILADAAKYDVACTSSGVDRKGKKDFIGNSRACGICHSFAADGRCISLLKILMTNHCIYDCKYCINRSSNDVKRATFTPDEICKLTIEFYKRNYIEGLFLSSGIINNPGYTMEKMCETLLLLRTKYKFNGYIHIKAIPGTADDLLAMAGYLADRISINMELPTEESLRKLAPNKSFRTIINPMIKLSSTIENNRVEFGKNGKMERSRVNRFLHNSIFRGEESDCHQINYNNIAIENSQSAITNSFEAGKNNEILDNNLDEYLINNNGDMIQSRTSNILRFEGKNIAGLSREFAPAGQSTQMIIGASGESDYDLIRTTQSLYQSFDLKRVFFSAYIPLNEDDNLPSLDTKPPLLREHRLYQADWLLRFYGFKANELLSEAEPNFNEKLDPKCNWAIRHLEHFPIEIQTASYDSILRIPGIGPRSAQRIIYARRYQRLDFDSLKRMGVVLKRAHMFITCQGRMMYNTPIDERFITNRLIADNIKENWQIEYTQQHKQMNLFYDFGLN